MLLNNKDLYMLTIWLIVILFGTAITIIGGLKFNEEWTKNNLKKQVHLIPDFLLIDFEVRLRLNEELTTQMLEEIKPKYHVHGESFEEQEKVFLTSFFDEKLFEEHKQAEMNYKLSENIYEQIRNFDLIAIAISKDTSTLITLCKNTNKVVFTQRDKNIEDSYIEVKEYDSKTKELHIFYHNIQVSVVNKKLSKFITDLDKGNLNLSFIVRGDVRELSNIVIKTKSTEYFGVQEITNEGTSYIAKLNLLLK